MLVVFSMIFDAGHPENHQLQQNTDPTLMPRYFTISNQCTCMQYGCRYAYGHIISIYMIPQDMYVYHTRYTNYNAVTLANETQCSQSRYDVCVLIAIDPISPRFHYCCELKNSPHAEAHYCTAAQRKFVPVQLVQLCVQYSAHQRY